MSTAREETRKAIASTLRSRRGAPEGSLPPRIDHLANAASDVWEPLLRDLVRALGDQDTFWVGALPAEVRGAYEKAKEALG